MLDIFMGKTANGSLMSRTDLWLSTPEVADHVSEVSISSSPLTDHCLLYLNPHPETRINKRNTYWKFNAELLKCDEYCNLIKDLMLEIKFDLTIGSYSSNFSCLRFSKFQLNLEKKEAKK